MSSVTPDRLSLQEKVHNEMANVMYFTMCLLQMLLILPDVLPSFTPPTSLPPRFLAKSQSPILLFLSYTSLARS